VSDTTYVTLDDLVEIGLTAADVRRLAPHAVEYTALDRRPCWLRDDLAELLGAAGGAA
jgi:hypothetical protein